MSKPLKKKYFIKDTSVNGVDNDLFNYADIAKVLGNIIESNEPPYNIAIIGKWGLGKSSLINLVKNRLIGNKAYLIQEINAWKYEKESLRRVFLKQLWQGVSGEKLKSFQQIQRTFSDLINNEIQHEKPKGKPALRFVLANALKSFANCLRRYCLPVLGIVLFTVVGFVAYKLIQAHTKSIKVDSLFWWNAVLSYCKNIGTTLLLPVLIALLTALHNEYRKKEPKKFEFNFPLETADDYELFLENAIADKLKKNPELKIVTIIDDLDRLSLEKIVEALDSIKAFVNLPNCVFVVPFDDEIIKSALEKRREIQFGENCEVIESELMLDKLFQFKVFLPPLLKYDISDYAMKLIRHEIPDFISDYCSDKTLNRLIGRIIIHSGVTTPRQVKKLVNAFVSNYLIAREREESGRVEKGLLSGERGIEQLARLSVLQADFNHFYDALFVDFSYLTRFTEIARSQSPKANVPPALCEYFQYNGDDKVIAVLPSHESLLNFLISTEKYSVTNIAPFIYLAQSAISIKTGDEQHLRAIAALESGNEATLKIMLSENPEIAEAIIAFIPDCADAELPLRAAFPLLSHVAKQYQTPLANALVERSIESNTDMEELALSIAPNDVLDVSLQAERDEHGTMLIDNYLADIVNEKNPNVDAMIKALQVFIPEHEKISSHAQKVIKRGTDICCNNNEMSVKSILSLLDYTDSKLFVMLWGMPWFARLCNHISDENDYSAATLDSLKKSFTILSDDENLHTIVQYAIPLFKLPPAIEVLDSMFTKGLCSQLDESQSTEIANALIAHKYDENSSNVHKMLSKLTYIVDEKNAEEMTAFTKNYKTSTLMDDVLVYMGKKGFFDYIEPTLSDLVKTIFDDDENDELLGNVTCYLSEKIRNELFALLEQKVRFTADQNHARELSILSVLSSNSVNAASIDNLAVNTLIPQYASRVGYPAYSEFIVRAIGTIKALLQEATINTYVDKLASNFRSYRANCLLAFELLSGALSAESFAIIFPLITTDITDSEFEQAFKILIDNRDVHPIEHSEDQAAYREFLVSHIENAIAPNTVLQTLSDAFSDFPEIRRLTMSALKNTTTDRNLLIGVVVKCFNNYKDIDEAAGEALSMFVGTQELSVLKEVLGSLTAYTLDDMFIALGRKIGDSTDIDTLINIGQYAAGCNSVQSKDIFIKVLTLGLERDNVPDKVVRIISSLSLFDKAICNTAKIEFIETLSSGFLCTASESIENTIVRIVRQHNWTRPFKKQLAGNDGKLSMFNKLAK